MLRERRLLIGLVALGIAFALWLATGGTSEGDVFVPQDVKDEATVRQVELVAPIQGPHTRQAPPRLAVRGVLLLLQGGRWGEDYLVRHNLPRLERYFLSCYPYPVIVFHENLPPASRRAISAAVPSANHSNGAHFEDVSRFWATLPHGISEDQLRQWMATGDQPRFQGRGYRLMCRFWHGLVWTLPVLNPFEYYWRLDTDAYLTRPVRADPFALMVQRGCQYGFNRLKGDAPGVVIGLWETFLKWVAQEPGVTPSALEHVKRFSLDPETQSKYLRKMYYNNFELGTVALKRHPLYQSYFQYVDEREPFGILRYRWGDAPLHTLGVEVVLQGRGVCNFTQEDVGYRHAVKRPPPIDEQRCVR